MDRPTAVPYCRYGESDGVVKLGRRWQYYECERCLRYKFGGALQSFSHGALGGDRKHAKEAYDRKSRTLHCEGDDAHRLLAARESR